MPALAALGLALGSPPALADTLPPGSVTLEPNTAGHASTLSIDLNGAAAGLAPTSAPPQGVTIAVQPGFGFDPVAVAGRCTPSQASALACPEDSRIGSGQLVIGVSGMLIPGGSQDYTAAANVFLADPVAPGDLAGIVITVSEPTTGMRGGATGRLVPVSGGPFATELRFDPLPSATLPPGFTITLKRATLRVGAGRTVSASTPTTPTSGGGQRRSRRRHRRQRSRHSGGKKRAHTAADVRHDLITNPPTCGGTWAGQVRLRYADHTDTRDVAVPCAA